MAGKISEYTNAVATFANGDLVDVSKRISTSPDTFQSQKLEFAQFQAFIQANASNILNTNGLTLGGNYSHDLDSNTLTFTNGTLNVDSNIILNSNVNAPNLPTASTGLNAGDFWNENGVVRVGTSGTGASSIYTSDGTIGAGRIATLTDNLTFKDTSARNIFNIGNNGELQFSAGGTMYGKMFTNGKWALGGSTTIGSQAGITLHRNTLVKSESNSSSNIALQVTDTSNSGFFRIYGDKRLLFGNTSFVSTENISLQKPTAIKGIGTSGSSALAIYDNDTTPNKVFEVLDDSTIKTNGNTGFTGTGAYTNFTIENGIITNAS